MSKSVLGKLVPARRRRAVRGKGRQDKPGPAEDKRDKPGPAEDKRDKPGLAEDGRTVASYEVAAQLKVLLAHPDTPAAAKVNAARTLAEIEGLLGRYQAPPERGVALVSALSRDELVAELDRLRTAVGLGIVS